MAQYTIELKTLLKMGFHLKLDGYPLFDEEYRKVLNNKIIQHFYFREIGQETPDRFNFMLERKMCEIMPYYNQLYQSELIKYDPLSTRYYEYTDVHDRTRKNNAERIIGAMGKESRGDAYSEYSTENATSNGTSTDTSNSKTDSQGTSERTATTDVTKQVSGEVNRDLNGTSNQTENTTTTQDSTRAETNGGKDTVIATKGTETTLTFPDRAVTEEIGAGGQTVNVGLGHYNVYTDAPNTPVPMSGVDVTFQTGNGVAVTGVSLGDAGGYYTTATIDAEKQYHDTSTKTQTNKTTQSGSEVTSHSGNDTTETDFGKTVNIAEDINKTGNATIEKTDTETEKTNSTENTFSTTNETENGSTSATSNVDSTSNGEITSTLEDAYKSDTQRNVYTENESSRSEKEAENINEYLENKYYTKGRNDFAPAELITKFRETFLNIDMLIIDQLEPLFMGVF